MSTRPRIEFDDRGFCSACLWAEQKKKINYALSNTFGFGGHVATVLIKKYKE